MRYFVKIGDRTLEVDLSGPNPIVEGEELPAELAGAPGTAIRHLLAGGHSVPILARAANGRGLWHLVVGSERLLAEAVDERTRAIREMTGAGPEETVRTIVAPMPGLVVRIEVEVGQQVRAGQGVAVVEAMKMENELKAPGDGRVAEVRVVAGATVEKGAILIVLE